MKGFLLATGAVLLTLTLAAPSDATLNACASAKQLCVAKKTAALLKCYGKNTKPPGMDPAKFADCVQKAQAKFDGGADPSHGCFGKLEAKLGDDCLTRDDTDELETAVDAFVQDVVCRLDPAGPGCPSCSDGIQNQNETDVDCGGSCPACGFGEMCMVPADCGATMTCSGYGPCICSAGRNDCNGVAADACEVDTASDVANCGFCGTVCAATNGVPSCNFGKCSMKCDPGFVDCNGWTDGCETNVTDNVNHCGACNNRCDFYNAFSSCVASSCVITSCEPGFGNCDGDVGNGCETYTEGDRSNCGSCGNVCAPGQFCNGGTCS